MWANVCLLVWEAEGDRAAGEHHQRERRLGGVEPIGAAGDEPHLVVERLDSGVVDPQPDGGEDAIAVLVDRGGELDERFQTAAAGLDAPAVQQFGRLVGSEVAGEDRPQALLEPIGAPGRAAVAAQRAQGGGLGVGQSLGSLEQHPACPLELLGLVGVHSAKLVPDLPADLIERVGGQRDDVDGSMHTAALGAWPGLATDFRYAAPMSVETAVSWADRCSPSSMKNWSQVAVSLPSAPHTTLPLR